jgi:hypothetical protein
VKPIKFDIWCQAFISSVKGEGAFMALEDLMGDHPEYEDLSDWVLVACFNAKKFQDYEKSSSEKKRDKVRADVQEIRGKGSNQVKAINISRDFIKYYPQAANAAMAATIRTSLKNDIILRKKKGSDPANDVIDKILAAYKAGSLSHEPQKNLHYWYQQGCILREAPIAQKLKNPATDGLIFEIAYHIKRYLYEKPLALVYGMPFPKAKIQLHGQNEVIAKFVNATLQTTAHYSRQDVKVRHDSLERQRTVLVSWAL